MISMTSMLSPSVSLSIVSVLTSFRFGNYIGEAVESEEEAQEETRPQAFAFDEAFEDEEDEEPQDQQLMEVDGLYPCH